MSARGALLSLGGLALFLAAFVPLVLRVRSGRDLALDSERLRRTYVALSLYQSENDGMPPASLAFVQRDMDEIDLRSPSDPRADEPGPKRPQDKANPYPYSWDGVLSTRQGSPWLVSWSYRYHWREAGDPRTTSLDPRRGLLADPWPGVLLRMTMDGAIVQKPRGGETFEGLFGR